MRILFLGDIVGRGARRAVRARLRPMRLELGLDLVVANGENASGGKGIDPDAADELLDAGIDVITTGNHVWQHRSLMPWLETQDRVLRPVNYPASNPGRGSVLVTARDGTEVGVVCVIGRAFLGPAGCPFAAVDSALAELRSATPVVIVDMHAEATAEKAAIAWHVDGKASAVIGTHTHVQTADERILPEGTAFLTDAGMCGPVQSIIGMRKDEVLYRFRTQMPTRFEVASGPIVLQGAVVELDGGTGRATSIRRLQEVQKSC